VRAELGNRRSSESPAGGVFLAVHRQVARVLADKRIIDAEIVNEGHALLQDVAHGGVGGIMYRDVVGDINVLRFCWEKRNESKKVQLKTEVPCC
jgi:hypothetical protein